MYGAGGRDESRPYISLPLPEYFTPNSSRRETILVVEFLFYLWNTIGEVVHGFGLFFHLQNPDLLLRTVFAIGYINLFASGYFLCLLLWKRSNFLNRGAFEYAQK